MSLYRSVTACADNFFVNKVAFFGTISLNLRYRFIACLFDRHVPTLLKACRILQRLYFMHGFLLRVLKMDPEFEPLRIGLEDMQILLNTTGQGDHVPEAERLVCTTKDSARAGFAGTPFKKLPVVLTVGLILATAFWGNAIAAADGVSKTLSPDAIVTGRRLQYKKHCRVPFGQYVQTFEDGDNTIEKERTLGAMLRAAISEQLVVLK